MLKVPALAATLPFVLCLTLVGAAQPAAVQPGQGTPTAPTPNALFSDTRIVDVQLSFSPQEFDALRPVRVGGSGGSESWLQGPPGHRNGYAATQGYQFPYVHADVVVDGTAVTNIGVRYK